MLGFILSKINMLILVIAMFTIIAYFMFSLTDIMKVHESQLMLSRLRDKADVLITAETYCDSTFHYFPSAIRITGADFYYIIKISTTEVEVDTPHGEETMHYLIFSLFPRSEYSKYLEKIAAGEQPSEQPSALAAASVRTGAEVKLYTILPGGTVVQSTDNITLIDPQGFPTSDAVVFVKQIEADVPKLYVIPCTTTGEICAANKTTVSCLVAGKPPNCDEETEGAFKC